MLFLILVLLMNNQIERLKSPTTSPEKIVNSYVNNAYKWIKSNWSFPFGWLIKILIN